MGSKSGLALKFLQWFIRGIEFCCAAVVLALSSYFLAALHNHNITIPTWLRAVEGISGAGVLYTLVGLLLLCCLAGHPFTSFVAIVLDVAFIGAFIYVATAYRSGASSCRGTVDTPFGTGNANDTPTGNTDGFTNLPTYRQACQMETACLAVSIVAILFFIFSILVEFVLVRHRRKESRFGPSPANNYTSGYGRRNKFMGLFKKRTTTAEDPNALPMHTTPDQVRQSYNTESTAVGHDPALHNKYGESGMGHDGRTAYPEQGVTGPTGTTHPPAGYRYNDGTYAA
ncbi:hypothetical protein JX265_003985 [Neoarthrinium moseri]|uniref:MARVEL domain-containing protein n=1 Tax=Neoarthrinium moseri TaxID=1658444 RepID=A0A9Q0ASP6_9PEZI|nr:uncharacterized protein JN550_006738 [Neoarthrinium moseri]KAI1867931.1 hypothetical protein JN550_006738 [Neoarthrinium moseri]KAI1876459.1 hypothetical protein JX265_003985 [Neoarthrinium moseri]